MAKLVNLIGKYVMKDVKDEKEDWSSDVFKVCYASKNGALLLQYNKYNGKPIILAFSDLDRTDTHTIGNYIATVEEWTDLDELFSHAQEIYKTYKSKENSPVLGSEEIFDVHIKLPNGVYFAEINDFHYNIFRTSMLKFNKIEKSLTYFGMIPEELKLSKKQIKKTYTTFDKNLNLIEEMVKAIKANVALNNLPNELKYKPTSYTALTENRISYDLVNSISLIKEAYNYLTKNDENAKSIEEIEEEYLQEIRNKTDKKLENNNKSNEKIGKITEFIKK